MNKIDVLEAQLREATEKVAALTKEVTCVKQTFCEVVDEKFSAMEDGVGE
jgi:hypothetical protein